MAVPSSGELKLWSDIWNDEIGGEQGNNSLHSASIYAGFSTPDAMSDFYGWSDVIPPSVTTNAITNNCPSCQTLNGNVTSTGGENVTRGFYHGTCCSAGGNSLYNLAGTQAAGTYSCNRTSLSCGARYYAWAYACNSAGSCIGGRVCAVVPYPPFTPIYCPTGRQFQGNQGNPSYPFQGGCFMSQYANPFSSALVTLQQNCNGDVGNCSVNNAKNRMCVWSFEAPMNAFYPTPWPGFGTAARAQANRCNTLCAPIMNNVESCNSYTANGWYGVSVNCNTYSPQTANAYSGIQAYINGGVDGDLICLRTCLCYCYS